MYKNLQVLDCHIHYALPTSPVDLVDIMNKTGTDFANLVIVPNRQRLNTVPDALKVKATYPDKFYVFASLDVSAYFRASKKVGIAMRDYAKQMLDCGCDGIKIIEGKPNMRKSLPVPDFDDEVWDPFFAWAESEQVPILWHVNDPETYWDIDNAPAFAKERGWFYDESYINNEKQYEQILNLLDKHPNLKIIFAHFFFMSAQLPRLSKILDKYPNVFIDTTHGIELYENLSKNQENAKQFFRKYIDRIVYGTDIGARCVLPGAPSTLNTKECLLRAQIAQKFLTENEPIPVKADGDFLLSNEDFNLLGMNLDEIDAQKVFADNFRSFVSKTPKKVNPKKVLKYLKTLKMLIRIMSMIDKTVKPDFTYVNQNEQFFKSIRKQ
ncbi:MAG: amidohydrolase family protein [Clostridia bacterium]|nr:amidohydrolase family protein [Clostridia bacterium]